jgi:Ribosome biogenesis protein SLX9
VRKSSDKGTSQRKRKRVSKKLAASLESLVEALPDITAATAVIPKSSKGSESVTQTLKSKPGALKKREKVVKEEKERFGKNLATLTLAGPSTNASTKNGDGVQSSSTDERWAALRKHLHGTVRNT